MGLHLTLEQEIKYFACLYGKTIRFKIKELHCCNIIMVTTNQNYAK